jgi:hypothetical protein
MYSKFLAVAAAAAIAAGSAAWGISHSGVSVGAKPPVAAVDAAIAAKAASETACTDVIKVDGGDTRKANVKLCAQTNGQSMKVKFSADCFSFYGGSPYPTCIPEGSWELYKGTTLVADETDTGSALYPGPGTYTLTASVHVKASMPNSQFTVDGEISQEITLTTAITPGPRLNGGTTRGGGTAGVTVTNIGDKPAAGVKIEISAHSDVAERSINREGIAITNDKRCRDEGYAEVCELGSLAPKASGSVELSSAAYDLCDIGETSTFTYAYEADGVDGLSGYGPC